MSRTPYARVGLTSRATALPFAERGFNVLLQSCRGTHGGSGGVFEPFVDEEQDGVATLDWIEKQPWYDGKVFMWGPSYVGYTQLATAVATGDRLAGVLPMVTSTRLNEALFPGNAFLTALAVQWIRRMVLLERSAALADFIEMTGDRRSQKAMHVVPMKAADKAGTGRTVSYYQDWMRFGGDQQHAYWQSRQIRDRIGDITAPVHLYGSWHDLCLPSQVRDYAALVEAGRSPYLTIGSHTHVDVETLAGGFREGHEWFSALASGDTSAVRPNAVKLFVQGADEWRAYDSFPPKGVAGQTWYLQVSGGLSSEAAGDGAPRTFRYDPNDPTPDFGGAMLDPKLSGRKEQAKREARSDVLVYTSEPLAAALEVIGAVSAQVKVRTSGPYFDVFVRLCDVDEEGVSTNVCDGILRVNGKELAEDVDGVRTVDVEVWPTAYQFKKGHRLRVQVCGGSFPHFARNTGTDDPLGSAELVPVDFEVLAGSTVTLSRSPTG